MAMSAVVDSRVHFCLRLEMAEIPRYILSVEGPAPDEIGPAFDQALMSANVEYSSKRRDRLGPVKVERLPPGTFAALRQASVAASGNEGQYKDPILLLDQRSAERLANAVECSTSC